MSDYFGPAGLGGPRGLINNPYRSTSNRIYPRTLHDALIWAAWLWERDANYRIVVQRIVSYFISGIKVTPTDDQEGSDSDDVDSLKDKLTDVYEILQLTNRFGIDMLAMGNAFVSCERLFSRMLLCPACRQWEMAIKQLRKGRDYTWNGKEFEGECPRCHQHVTYVVKDVPAQTPDGKKLRFVFRDPQDIKLQYNQLTGDYLVYYKMPDYIKDAIKRGDEVYLQTAPKVFLEAAQTDDYIAFDDEMLYHDRMMTLAPMDRLYKGFSVPPFLHCFDTIISLAFLHKFNEAITQDYIAPLRIISPDPANLKAGVDDPNRMPMSGATFRNFMGSSLKHLRSNPSTFIVSPVAVQAQQIGGDGAKLAPVDLMEWYTTQLLNQMGCPSELRQTNFQVVAPSMGLRMFERQWVMYAKSLHKFTHWIGQKVCDIEKIENMSVDLDITSFVEDDMNKQVKLQLMQGGVISKTEVLGDYGIDFQKDLDQRMQEQKAEQEANIKMQTQDAGAEMVNSVMPPPGSLGVNAAGMAMQAAMGGGEGGPAGPAAPAAPGMPAGMAPGGASAAQGGTMEQQWQEAMEMAQQLYAAPPNVRRSELVNLKATNPQLHSFVKSMLDQMEQDVASDAVAQSKTPQG